MDHPALPPRLISPSRYLQGGRLPLRYSGATRRAAGGGQAEDDVSPLATTAAALQRMEGARAHDARSDDADDGVSRIGHPAAGPLLLTGNKTTEAAHISTSECLQLAPQQRRVHDLR